LSEAAAVDRLFSPHGVFVHDRKVLGVVLHGNYGIVIDYKEKTSAEIADALQEALLNE
jgi:hypothetical protein